MKNTKLFLLASFVVPLLAISCGGKGGPQKKNAPVDQMDLTISNYVYDQLTPEPTISGMESVKKPVITYSYRASDSSDDYADYVSGIDNYINVGSYTLKASVSSKNYKDFELTTEFTVSEASFGPIDFVAHDYYWDECKPQPTITNEPEGSTITLKYYDLVTDKHYYVPFEQNDIAPGSYTLEATISKPNYETVVKTYGFVVFEAEFDSRYELNTSVINLGTLDYNFSINSVNLNNYLHITDTQKGQQLDGVNFTWRVTPSFVCGEDVAAEVKATKENFVDKIYNVTLKSSKTLVDSPFLAFGDGEYYTSPFTYDGTKKTVFAPGAYSNYYEIIDELSTTSATDAGTYYVVFVLKHSNYNTWSDGTIEYKTVSWKIEPKEIAIPTLNNDSYTWSGSDFSVTLLGTDEDFEDYVDISGVQTANSVGSYKVYLDLKDTNNYVWSDGTTEQKELSWEIVEYNPYGSSSGWRFTIGDVVGEKYADEFKMSEDQLQGQVTLKMEFEFTTGNYTNYEEADFTVDKVDGEPNPYAHIVDHNKLVFDQFGHAITLHVGSTNPNHYVSNITTVTIDPTLKRTLVFDKDHVTNSYYGLDEMRFYGQFDYSEVPVEGGLYSVATTSSGFRLSGTFKSVDKVTVIFDVPQEGLPSFKLQAYLNANGSFVSTDGPLINKTVPADGRIEYDFTHFEFDESINYHLVFWTFDGTGSALVTSVTVEYTVA